MKGHLISKITVEKISKITVNICMRFETAFRP